MAPDVTTMTCQPSACIATTSAAREDKTERSTSPDDVVTDDVPTLITTRLVIVLIVTGVAQVQAAVTSQTLTTSGAVVLTAIETGATFVAPPFE